MERGGLWMDPRGLCSWHGQLIHLTRNEHTTLWSILKADGRIISNTVLSERIGYDGDHNMPVVLLSRVRKKLDAIAPNPIENEWGKGYRLKEVQA